MVFQPNPINVARNASRNQGKRGDTIVYREHITGLQEEMLVEDVTGASDGINVVYLGAGNRIIHSRYVIEVRRG